jgi:hypothetical protein
VKEEGTNFEMGKQLDNELPHMFIFSMHRNESKKEALGIKREKKGIEGDHLVKN